MWGGKIFFVPPLLYLLSSACAVHLLFSVQMTSCLSQQLLPSNWITGEENSCYPNSSLPLVPVHNFHMHHAYFNTAQNIWVLFNSNPPGGWAGNFFFNSDRLCSEWLFKHDSLAEFSNRHCFNYFCFSLILKGSLWLAGFSSYALAAKSFQKFW